MLLLNHFEFWFTFNKILPIKSSSSFQNNNGAHKRGVSPSSSDSNLSENRFSSVQRIGGEGSDVDLHSK